MAVNLLSMVSALSRVCRIEPINDNEANDMNVKISSQFMYDKPPMEKLSSSSSSSGSPNVLLGIKQKKAAITASASSSDNKNPNNCNNSPHNQDNPNLSDAGTLNKPLPFHSHKELALAERSIRKLVEDSRFFPPEAAREDWFHRSSNNASLNSHEENPTKVSTLYEHELQVGRILGRGGFCQVRLTSLFKSNTEYALKYLQPSNKSKSSFARGAADLAIEARFLSLLQHENIIELHYVSEGTLAEVYNCLDVETDMNGGDCVCHNQGQLEHTSSLRTFGYFLVLDYLRDTLLQRIQILYIPSMISNGFSHPKAHHNKHRCHYGQHTSMIKGIASKQETQLRWWNKKLWQRNRNEEEECSRKMNFLRDSLRKRLDVVRQVASALEYLHANGIVYRDSKFFFVSMTFEFNFNQYYLLILLVKPDNIGFYFKPNNNLYSDDPNYDGIPKRTSLNPVAILYFNQELALIIFFTSFVSPLVFDFGLVKELKPSLRKSSPAQHSYGDTNHVTEDDENALFKLTGRTGSRR